MSDAGAIFIGKTNTAELGVGGHTTNRLFGETSNPYNLSKSAGGSSGGAGVAVAANLLPFTDGTDMMGSCRTPAAFTNIYGFSQHQALFLITELTLRKINFLFYLPQDVWQEHQMICQSF